MKIPKGFARQPCVTGYICLSGVVVFSSVLNGQRQSKHHISAISFDTLLNLLKHTFKQATYFRGTVVSLVSSASSYRQAKKTDLSIHRLRSNRFVLHHMNLENMRRTAEIGNKKMNLRPSATKKRSIVDSLPWRRSKMRNSDPIGVPEMTDASTGSTSVFDNGLYLTTEIHSLPSRQTYPKALQREQEFLHCLSVLRTFERLIFAGNKLLNGIVQSDDKKRKYSEEKRERLFWTSISARKIYAILFIGLLTQQPIVWYGALVIVLNKVFDVCVAWGCFYSDDQHARAAFKSLRSFFRLLINESDKAINGDYSRKVLAAYLVYNCTAPGESYFGYMVRYKMSRLNEQVIEELQEWREKNLGYEKSSRNLFQ